MQATLDHMLTTIGGLFDLGVIHLPLEQSQSAAFQMQHSAIYQILDSPNGGAVLGEVVVDLNPK